MRKLIIILNWFFFNEPVHQIRLNCLKLLVAQAAQICILLNQNVLGYIVVNHVPCEGKLTLHPLVDTSHAEGMTGLLILDL